MCVIINVRYNITGKTTGKDPRVMIEIKNLRKTFPHKNVQNKKAEKVAVENLSLTINTGEIFGLLGPNGAGKTTTIRMLTMLTRPTAGEILYEG